MSKALSESQRCDSAVGIEEVPQAEGRDMIRHSQRGGIDPGDKC